MRKSGFTLIEMLVVMAIIGILAGLMFPALGAVKKKAYATQTHELVTQMQSAWLIHFNDFRSFPPASFMTETAGAGGYATGAGSSSGSGDGKDTTFPMTPYNLCVLNWRCPKPSDYQGTTDKWSKALAAAYKEALENSNNADKKPHGLKIKATATNGKSKEFSVDTRDAYFEISQMQWMCGVLNAWGERKAQALYKKGGASAVGYENIKKVLEDERRADPIVYVRLDTGYDGKVDTPVTTALTTATVLNKTAVAWVSSESPRDDCIVSW